MTMNDKSPITSAERRPQLETLAQAEAQNLRRVDALTDRAPEIAAALEACSPDAFCCLVICAVCSRRYRFRIIRQLLAIAKSRPGQHEVATIFLEAFPVGKLATADVKRAHNRLRKLLERNGFKGSHLIGGTEVNWDSATRRGSCTFTCSRSSRPRRVEKAPQSAARRRAEVSREGSAPPQPGAADLVLDQIGYLLPTTVAQWCARSPAVPLPPDRLTELAAWSSRYTPNDFTFLFGARRRGGRIPPATARNSSNSHKAEFLRNAGISNKCGKAPKLVGDERTT